VRVPMVWLRLRWPREIEADTLIHAWRILAYVAGWPVIAEAIGSGGNVTQRIAVPYSKQTAVTRQLRSSVPGIDISEDNGSLAREPLNLNMALALRLSTPSRSLSTNDPISVSHALMTALSAARKNEQLVLQWILGRNLRPTAVSNRPQSISESWIDALARPLGGSGRQADSEARRELALKRSEAGWRAVGRIAVAAADEHRQRHLLAELLGALRLAESPGLQLHAHRIRPAIVHEPRQPWRWPLRLNLKELAAVSSWPVGTTSDLPLQTIHSRVLPPRPVIPSRGLVLAESTYPGEERPLALSPSAALRHLHVLGPTGVGKSTLLLNLITQSIKGGHGVAVIEPKGDLIEDVLAHIPEDRMDDVVVLDPSDNESPVGLNPLAPAGRPPELVADQLLAVFHRLYAAHWGPRTNDILGNALATMALIRNMTLCALPPLLTDPRFRRVITEQVNDPIGLGPFWSGFDAWSEGERTAAIAPVLNKLRPFLINPRLRAVVGQANPRFTMDTLFNRRAILLVNLAKGKIGPEAASLLGSLVLAQLWQASLNRSAIPEKRRRPVFVFVDEFQDYLHLPVDLEEALGQARGLGVGLVMAHQHLRQLSPDMRSAVLANARNRLCFQLGSEDAKTMATSTVLEPTDFMSLSAFECYLQLVAWEAAQPWCSAKTYPAPKPISQAEAVRAASRARYGTPRSQVESAIADMIGTRGPSSTEALQARRRPRRAES
jgi:hypothetical protein